MDKKDFDGIAMPFDFDIARSIVDAAEEAWQLPRIWFACWWNVIVDCCWPPHDFARRD